MKRKLWAAPHNLTSRFGEKFFARSRFEKRGNTACISSFSNRRIGEKDPPKRVGAIARCCPKFSFHGRTSFCFVLMQTLAKYKL